MANVGDAAQSSGDIMRRLREAEAAIRELTAGRRLENASVGKGGIRVREDGSIRSETFDGNLLLGNPGTAGWALGADRLALKGQLVGPFDFEGRGANENVFSVTTTRTHRATVSIPVPFWAEEALVLCSVTGQAVNDRGVQDYLGLKPVVNDSTLGADAFFLAASNNIACGSVTFSVTIPVEDLTSVTCAAEIWANGGTWSANAVTFVQVNGTAIFRRAG
jgi:hypothetical protein